MFWQYIAYQTNTTGNLQVVIHVDNVGSPQSCPSPLAWIHWVRPPPLSHPKLQFVAAVPDYTCKNSKIVLIQVGLLQSQQSKCFFFRPEGSHYRYHGKESLSYNNYYSDSDPPKIYNKTCRLSAWHGSVSLSVCFLEGVALLQISDIGATFLPLDKEKLVPRTYCQDSTAAKIPSLTIHQTIIFYT